MNNVSARKESAVVVYTDGGARGNPGPAALGVYIETLNKKYRERCGSTTNNDAEYQAIIFALKKCRQLLGKEKAKQTAIEIRSDSQLIVSQLNGVYRIKEKSLGEHFIAVWNLKQDFRSVSFVHIPREENTIADKLVNEALDGDSPKGLF